MGSLLYARSIKAHHLLQERTGSIPLFEWFLPSNLISKLVSSPLLKLNNYTERIPNKVDHQLLTPSIQILNYWILSILVALARIFSFRASWCNSHHLSTLMRTGRTIRYDTMPTYSILFSTDFSCWNWESGFVASCLLYPWRFFLLFVLFSRVSLIQKPSSHVFPIPTAYLCCGGGHSLSNHGRYSTCLSSSRPCLPLPHWLAYLQRWTLIL